MKLNKKNLENLFLFWSTKKLQWRRSSYWAIDNIDASNEADELVDNDLSQNNYTHLLNI